MRAFKAVGGTPLFIREAEGCHVVDIDGNRYIDYVASYGPIIVGHANERVVAALSKAIGRGSTRFWKICSRMPGNIRRTAGASN